MYLRWVELAPLNNPGRTLLHLRSSWQRSFLPCDLFLFLCAVLVLQSHSPDHGRDRLARSRGIARLPVAPIERGKLRLRVEGGAAGV